MNIDIVEANKTTLTASCLNSNLTSSTIFYFSLAKAKTQ